MLSTAWTVARELIIVAAFIGITTSLARWSGNIVVAALQLLLPLTVLASALIAVAAIVTADPLLAISGAIVVLLSLPLFVPKLVPDPSRRRASDAPSFSVVLANLYFDNPEPDDAIEQLIAADADILVMTELSVDLLDRFDRLGGAQQYPSRVHPEPIEGEYAVGIFSQTELQSARVEQHGELQLIAATWVGVLASPSDEDAPPDSRKVEVRAVHPDAPSTRTGFTRWRHQLRELRTLLRDLTALRSCSATSTQAHSKSRMNASSAVASETLMPCSGRRSNRHGVSRRGCHVGCRHSSPASITW